MNYAQIYADLKTLMVGVSDKIGQGATYGWTVVVKQQYITGITDFIYAGGLLIAGIATSISLFFAIRAFIRARNDEAQVGYFFVATALVFTSVALYAAVVTYTVDGVQHLLNPDYYAIQFFIDLVKPAAAAQ